MRFRADVAGLRAVAVVPILLLHAGIGAIPGGFIGVDIFFVISGFLITAILMREMEGGKFSLLGFYRRRAVRILPALLAMLAVTLVAGIVILFPSDLRELGYSSAATAGFGSNILFWRTASYFSGTPELRPLLHTWSLGVEEQFYIFYPLLLILVRRFAPKHLKLVLILVALGSAVLALLAWRSSPMLAFFLLPTRAWELSLGGLVAIQGFPALNSAKLRGAVSGLGLALIVAGLFLIDEKSMFPMPWGLLPCVGTALLIAYGEAAPTARLLGWAPMRGIGAISYSLYLWHWPILSFWRFRTGVELSAADTAITIALSFVAAIASYFLIERPFLRRFHDGDARRIVVVAAVAIIAMIGASLAVARTAEKLHPLAPEVARIAAYGEYTKTDEYKYQFRPGECFSTPEITGYDPAKCLAYADGEPNILLVGDSLAAHLWRAIAERHPGANVMQATGAVCFPYFGSTGDDRCNKILQDALTAALSGRHPDRVILAAVWMRGDLEKLLATVRQLRAKGIPVTVIGPVAEYREEFPRLLARAVSHNDRAIVDKAALAEIAPLDAAMRGKVTAAGADYVSLHAVQCPAGKCRLFAPNGEPMLSDEHHLTLAGARTLVAAQPIF